MPTLRPKPLQPRSFYQGATFRGRIALVYPDGTVKGLVGATIRWALYQGLDNMVVGPYTIGNGIAFDGPAQGGALLVTIPASVTDALPVGTYEQEWRIVDNIGDVQKYRGDLFCTSASLDAV
jgi:hypothetical protein